MTKSEISKTETGSVTSFEETPDERSARIERAGREAAQRIHVTPGQRRTLERVQAKAR